MILIQPVLKKISVKHSARKPGPHVSRPREELLEEPHHLQSLTVSCYQYGRRPVPELRHYLTSKGEADQKKNWRSHSQSALP
jgi:hypothetical protein